MRGATSGPTSRALDVLELLGRNPSSPMRYVDIVRELALNQGTAHSILKTLVDRGWVSRNPDDKTFTLGPAAAAFGAKADQARPLLQAVRGAAQELALELGFPASVVELVNGELMITAVYPGSGEGPMPVRGTCVPYAPPYGAVFAMSAPEPEQAAWIARALSLSPEVSAALRQMLVAASKRGFDIDWTTPAVANLMTMADSLQDLHPSLLAAMDQILLELTAISFDSATYTGKDVAMQARPVTSIIAPVTDGGASTRLALALHPMGAMAVDRIQHCGERLVAVAQRVSALFNAG